MRAFGNDLLPTNFIEGVDIVTAHSARKFRDTDVGQDVLDLDLALDHHYNHGQLGVDCRRQVDRINRFLRLPQNLRNEPLALVIPIIKRMAGFGHSGIQSYLYGL